MDSHGRSAFGGLAVSDSPAEGIGAQRVAMYMVISKPKRKSLAVGVSHFMIGLRSRSYVEGVPAACRDGHTVARPYDSDPRQPAASGNSVKRPHDFHEAVAMEDFAPVRGTGG
nr:hypothetical protein [Thauera sp. K11]